MGRKIVISYNPDPKLIGQEQVVDDAEAAQLIREGRARWADTDPADASDPRARAKDADSDGGNAGTSDDGQAPDNSQDSDQAGQDSDAPTDAPADGAPASDPTVEGTAPAKAAARKAAKSTSAAAEVAGAEAKAAQG